MSPPKEAPGFSRKEHVTNHPNSKIVTICASVGIRLKKGEAAKILIKAGSLDRQEILKAAGATSEQLALANQATKEFLIKDAARTHLNRILDRCIDNSARSQSIRAIAYDRFLQKAIDKITDNEPVDNLLPDIKIYLSMAIEDKRVTEVRPMFLRQGQADDLLLLEHEPTSKSIRDSGYDYQTWMISRRSAETEILAKWLDKACLDTNKLYSILTTPIIDEQSLLPFQCFSEFFGRIKTNSSINLPITDLITKIFKRLDVIQNPDEEIPVLLRQRRKERETIYQHRLLTSKIKAQTFVSESEAQIAIGCDKQEFAQWVADNRIPVAQRQSFTINGVATHVTKFDPETFPAIIHNLPEWRRHDPASSQTDVPQTAPAALKEAARLAGYPNVSTKNERTAVKVKVPFTATLEIAFSDATAVAHCRNFVVETAIPRKNLRIVLSDIKPILDSMVSSTIAAMTAAASSCATRAETLASGLPDDRIPKLLDLFSRKTPTSPGIFDNNLKKVTTKTSEWLIHALEAAANELIALDAASTIHARSGLANYPALFPQARAIKREIVLHVGPTNSGKTHEALDILAKAQSGLYAAPLRLMALEAYERMNIERSVPCHLLTGEEKIEVAGANHVACTIEMSNYTAPINVAVIDEVQMLADDERGWAWTAAIVGLPAQTLILTGSADAIPYIQRIIAMTGDVLTIKTFQRKTSLTVIKQSLQFKDLQPGDALIAFSRSETLRLREELSVRNKKIAVIYGALGPEVRRAEANRFRSGEADILIATDCIGLGLNLPCRRVLFTSLHKYDGVTTRKLKLSEIRQIAGRAGRFGLHETGETGMFGAPYDPIIASALTTLPGKPKDPRLFAMPPYGAIIEASRLLKTDNLRVILDYFSNTILKNDPHLRPPKMTSAREIAAALDIPEIPLEMKTRYLGAPLDKRIPTAPAQLRFWARRHAENKQCTALVGPKNQPTTNDELKTLENNSALAGLYLWLSQRWPEIYVEKVTAEKERSLANGLIEETLRRKVLARTCRQCGAKLPIHHQASLCRKCEDDPKKTHHLN